MAFQKKLIAGKHSCVGQLSAMGGDEESGSPEAGYFDRNVMLVYTGKFDSMDGEVEITDDHLSALAENHNARVASSSRLASGEPNMADFPPLQLDHSTSAAMTVGRVPFQLKIGEYNDKTDGKAKKALFGRVRFLGRENVEKAKDGRYTHVSIGADLETGTLNELSITPFPAAPNAALLSKEKVAQNATSNGGSGSMDKEKLKKHLMEHHKMSAEDAEKKMASMSEEEGKKLAAEVDEKEKKMAADEDEKKKLAADEDEEKNKKAEMSANKASFVSLAKGFKTASATARLNQKKGTIAVRLSALRSKAKITPAEIKALDIAKLAEKSDEAIDAVLDSMEKREPQVLVGLFGTQKGDSAAKLAKQSMLNSLEMEARVQFTSNSKNKKFSEGKAQGSDPAAKMEGSDVAGADVHSENAPKEHLALHEAAMKAMAEGKHEEALAHMNKLGEVLKRMSGQVGEEKEEHVKDAQSHMAALAQDVKTMQNLFDDIVKLSSATLGVEASEI